VADDPSAPVTAADFIADPAKAIEKVKAQIRADVRKEVIELNVIAAVVIYLLLSKGR
jgi:hypothetical protein